MEHTDEKKKLDKKALAQLIFSLAIFLLVCVLLFATIKLSKNIDIFKKDPITYGVENSDFSYCYCYDLLGNKFNFPKQEIKESDIFGTS